MAAIGNDKETYDNMARTARRMLERTENQRDVAMCLYQYNEKMLCAGGCLLMPGDYMCRVDGGLVSSRGAVCPLSPDEILELIDGGALDKLFSMDDLNAPDFSSRIAKVMDRMGVQEHFHDASCWYKGTDPETGLEKRIAVYDAPAPDGGMPRPIASVESDSNGTSARAGARSGLGTIFRQCSYEEYNPGGREMLEESRSVNMERQNAGRAYDRLREAYLQNGQNRVGEPQEAAPKPEEAAKQIAGFDKLPATERLKLMKDAQDRYSEQMDQQAALSSQEDLGPSLPGQKGGFDA